MCAEINAHFSYQVVCAQKILVSAHGRLYRAAAKEICKKHSCKYICVGLCKYARTDTRTVLRWISFHFVAVCLCTNICVPCSLKGQKTRTFLARVTLTVTLFQNNIYISEVIACLGHCCIITCSLCTWPVIFKWFVQLCLYHQHTKNIYILIKCIIYQLTIR